MVMHNNLIKSYAEMLKNERTGVDTVFWRFSTIIQKNTDSNQDMFSIKTALLYQHKNCRRCVNSKSINDETGTD